MIDGGSTTTSMVNENSMINLNAEIVFAVKSQLIGMTDDVMTA